MNKGEISLLHLNLQKYVNETRWTVFKLMRN